MPKGGRRLPAIARDGGRGEPRARQGSGAPRSAPRAQNRGPQRLRHREQEGAAACQHRPAPGRVFASLTSLWPAPGVMTPGKVQPGKGITRSCAPVATTIARALTSIGAPSVVSAQAALGKDGPDLGARMELHAGRSGRRDGGATSRLCGLGSRPCIQYCPPGAKPASSTSTMAPARAAAVAAGDPGRACSNHRHIGFDALHRGFARRACPQQRASCRREHRAVRRRSRGSRNRAHAAEQPARRAAHVGASASTPPHASMQHGTKRYAGGAASSRPSTVIETSAVMRPPGVALEAGRRIEPGLERRLAAGNPIGKQAADRRRPDETHAAVACRHIETGRSDGADQKRSSACTASKRTQERSSDTSARPGKRSSSVATESRTNRRSTSAPDPDCPPPRCRLPARC